MEGRTWMLIAGALSVVLLGGGVCVCGGMGLLIANVPDDLVASENAAREGALFGAHANSDQCITQAHEHTLRCGVMEITCNTAATDFLRSCLRAMPVAEPSLCDDVPAPSTFVDLDFGDALCTRHGWANEDGDCDPIADGLSIFCAR